MKKYPPGTTVMVALTNEAAPCWRPVQAKLISGDTYQLTGTMPAYEKWQFKTGQIVLCTETEFADGTKALVAQSLK